MRPLVGSVLLVAALALSACGSDSEGDSKSSASESAEPETFDVVGAISIRGGCGSQANSYYPDITDGAQVTILDADSTPIALGALEEGQDTKRAMGPCTFPFTVEDVPVGESPIYSVSIGSRDPYQFTQDDASSLFLSLGD